MTTNPLPPVEALKVEKVDRDAAMKASKFMKYAYDPKRMGAGGYDLDPLVLQFARHRLAIRPEPASGDVEARAREMTERLRKYASGTEGNTTMMRDVAARLMYEASDLIASLQASPALRGGGDGWEPIESAPRDGRALLGFCPYDWASPHHKPEYTVIRWDESTSRWMQAIPGNYVQLCEIEPTHYLALPAPPPAMKGAEG